MPTPFMGLTLPTDHDTNDLWGLVLNQAFGQIDAHRHLPGEGRQVTSDGLNIDKALNYNGFLIKTLGGAAFTPTTVPSVNTSLFVSDGSAGLAANELYWRSAAGASVKLTTGATINISVVGGIVDDYASVGARLGYDDGLKRYTFREGTGDGNNAAHIHSGSIRISPFNGALGGFYVEQAAPAGLATNYIITWPLNIPATTAITQVDNTGAVSFSNTIAKAATFTELATFTAGATAAANQSITVSGTGEFKHGTRTLPLSAVGMQQISGAAFTRNGDGSIQFNGVSVGGLSLPVLAGNRVTSLVIAGFGDGAVDPLVQVFKFNSTGGTAVYATATITNAPAGWNDTTLTPGSPAALLGTECLFLIISSTAGTFVANTIRVVYDRP